MRFPGFVTAVFGCLLCIACSCPAALAAGAPDAPLTADNLLNDCVSPTGTGQHAACLVMVGSIMDGVDVAAIAARKANLKPSICIPVDLDRQTVIEKFIYFMGTGNGAYEKERAAVVVGAVLMSYPCK